MEQWLTAFATNQIILLRRYRIIFDTMLWSASPASGFREMAFNSKLN